MLLCTLIDTVIIGIIFIDKRGIHTSSSSKSLDDLEIRSSYIHLDDLWKNKNFPRIKHERIINHARGIYQVSSAKPNSVIPVYSDIRLANVGMAPVYTRRLLVDSQVRTVVVQCSSCSLNRLYICQTSSMVQFRVMDFGMENCTLAIAVPSMNKTNDVIISGNDAKASIDIWMLPPMTKRLDFRTLTWANKPSRTTHFYSLPVEYGETSETPAFHCSSLSHQTFEITCATPGCHIDIIGRGSHSSGMLFFDSFVVLPWFECHLGLHMWQYQSV